MDDRDIIILRLA